MELFHTYLAAKIEQQGGYLGYDGVYVAPHLFDNC